MSRRVCVTGGAGFIGSHLVERLLADGHTVTVIDNLVTGRLQNLPVHPRLTLIRKDVSEPVDLPARFYSGMEWVFHLAALADIVPSVSDPLAYHQANVNGTMRV